MAEERDDEKRGQTWEKEDIIILLEWEEESIQQCLKECTRKKPIWQVISSYLEASGYDERNRDSFETWIHTLILAYRGSKDAWLRSGITTPKAPFFDEIDDILSHKQATRPVIILSTTVLESGQSKETELTDGKKSPQSSCSFPTLEKEKRKKANKNHLPSLLGWFVVVSMLTRKCYVVCHLTNLLCNKRHMKKKHDKMEPWLIAIFAKSNIDFNVVLYSILHLKPKATD